MEKKLEVGLMEEDKEVLNEEVSNQLNEDEVDMYDVLNNLIPRVFLKIEHLENIPIDEKEFIKGVKEMSKDCGKIAALTNIGVPMDTAISYILSKEEGVICRKALESNGRSQV